MLIKDSLSFVLHRRIKRWVKKKCGKVDENLKLDVKPWVKDFTLEELGPMGLFNEYLEMSKFSINLINQFFSIVLIDMLVTVQWLVCSAISQEFRIQVPTLTSRNFNYRINNLNAHSYWKEQGVGEKSGLLPPNAEVRKMKTLMVHSSCCLTVLIMPVVIYLCIFLCA